MLSRFAGMILVAGLLLALVGCTEKVVVKETILLKGKLTKSGTPLTVDSSKLGDYAKVEVIFVPSDKGPKQGARVAPDGTFVLSTESGQPLPPGKYKVAVRQWEPYPKTDLLQGKFDEQRTPITVELAADQKEINIDIDKPKG